MPTVPTADQLSQIMSHAIAPAFLLGAVAAYISILLTRMTMIIDRIRILNDIADEDVVRVRLRSDIPRLKRRAELLNKATYLALGSGICTTLLLMLGFVMAFFGFRHEYGAAALFVIAVCLIGASLVRFAQEVRIALHEFENYR
jgi:Protein of unknown function (DUF2721)